MVAATAALVLQPRMQPAWPASMNGGYPHHSAANRLQTDSASRPVISRVPVHRAPEDALSRYQPVKLQSVLDYVIRAFVPHEISELAPSKLPDFVPIRCGGTNRSDRAPAQ